ncbi:virulence factor TspB C-terminal domain-related protein [Psychrobacter aquimaris]|uniref:virulence factor TspB C-terminal domain-related protein n=1 Tax=Psychrobacter aquimaris TaxID=292733 RepID=UPI003FD4CE8E
MRNLYYLLKMVRLSLPYKAKKYITILLFIMMGFFLFNSAFAVYDPNPKHSKWFHDSIVNDPLNKSSVEVKAQRTYPVTVYDPATSAKNTITKPQKSVIKVAAKVGNVGKSLVKRTPVGAITQALIGLGIGAVDWVMDPENNRIKYQPRSDASWGDTCKFNMKNTSVFGNSPSNSCAALNGTKASTGYVYQNSKYIGIKNGSHTCSYEISVGGGVNSGGGTSSLIQSGTCNEPDSNPKYVPISDVAQQVIQDADSGDAPAMQVMSDTALDMLEQGLLDPDLESAAEPKQFGANESDPLGGSNPNPDPETDPDPDPETDPDGESPTPAPEIEPFELPPFCAWATKVCDFIDWVQTPPSDPEDGAGDIEVEKPDPDMHVGILERLYIDMPAECPPDPVLEFMGAKIPFPMSVFCQFASMMKPLILLFAYIKGLSIIGNGLN